MRDPRIKLSPEVEELFSTRAIRCLATDCRNHDYPASATCNLRRIEVGEGGQCMEYEPGEGDGDG